MIQAGLSKTCRQVPAHHAYATLSRTMGNRAAFLRRPRNTDSFDQFRLRFAARHAYFALAKKEKGPHSPQRPRRNRPRLRGFPPFPPETSRTGCGRTWPPETPQGRRERPRAAPRSAWRSDAAGRGKLARGGRRRCRRAATATACRRCAAGSRRRSICGSPCSCGQPRSLLSPPPLEGEGQGGGSKQKTHHHPLAPSPPSAPHERRLLPLKGGSGKELQHRASGTLRRCRGAQTPGLC